MYILHVGDNLLHSDEFVKFLKLHLSVALLLLTNSTTASSGSFFRLGLLHADTCACCNMFARILYIFDTLKCAQIKAVRKHFHLVFCSCV